MVPKLLLEKPDIELPELKNLRCDRIETSGFVNANTTTRSIRVVNPSVNANPRTPPTAKK
jgi:hypothetical protein